MIDIHKAGGVIVKDRRVLVARSFNKDSFMTPGGKLKNEETPIQALERELMEEIQISVDVDTLEHLGTFEAEAAGKVGVNLRMDVYLVKHFSGEPEPSSEIEEIRWINSQVSGIEIDSIFEHDVMPLLKQRNLID